MGPAPVRHVSKPTTTFDHELIIQGCSFVYAWVYLYFDSQAINCKHSGMDKQTLDG